MTANLVPSFFEQQAEVLSGEFVPLPKNVEDWQTFQQDLRKRHAAALGVPVEHASGPISYRTLETLKRQGYTLKKILFDSRPHLPIPAHLYLPSASETPCPAVLCVHGHWKGAKNAPEVHKRCVFLALRGFVVLAIDAIGAGERAYQGITYHGRQLGYQVLPGGQTLAGLQVEDNRRAIDLLQSLPEVDPERIGVTGASGGGNQTFNLAVMDPRVRAAVAVCFFGSYRGYLRGAHCACELVPGGLTYADEGRVASLVVPRALAIYAAQEDRGAAFRIGDARNESRIAEQLYDLAGAGDRFEFVEFPGGHDYSQPMRETMVAFFEKHLKGESGPEKIPEPELDLLSRESLRVLDEEGLPEGTLYVPEIAAHRVGQQIEAFEKRGKDWADPSDRADLRQHLIEKVFGGFPGEPPSPEELERMMQEGEENPIRLATEPGVVIPLSLPATAPPHGGRLLLALGEVASGSMHWKSEKIPVASLFPRGTGPTRWPAANTVGCQDYLLAQGSNILGRPMMGQWVWDTRCAVAALHLKYPGTRIELYGEGAMGLVALLTAILDEKVHSVTAVDTLSSYLWSGRFDDRWGLVHFVPGILEAGDIPDLARGVYPRSLSLLNPRNGGGSELAPERRQHLLTRIGEGLGSSSWLKIE